MASPFLFSEPLESGQPDVILVSAAFFVRQVCQFHWFQHAVHNHRGTQAGAQTKEKHSSAFVTAQRLHRRIVNDFHGTPKRFFEIKFYPSLPEVVWFADDTL